MRKLIVLFVISISLLSFSSQPLRWIKKPKHEWPAIGMINEIWINQGQRSVRPPFEYAATAFVVDNGKDTLAITVKNVQWVSKDQWMNQPDLKTIRRWVMHPKGNSSDSVVIGQRISEDRDESIHSSESQISEQDWIVLTTKYVSPNVQTLKPRYTSLKPGEKIFYFPCSYGETRCTPEEATVTAVNANQILFVPASSYQMGGASGSPLTDENGLWVGVLGGSMIARDGEPVLYATSANALNKIVTQKTSEIQSIPVVKILKPVMIDDQIAAAMEKINDLRKIKNSFFTFAFSPKKFDTLIDDFQKEKRIELAISTYQFSLHEIALSDVYLKLGKAYLDKGEKEQAEKALRNSLKLYPDNPETLKLLNQIAPGC